jgi:hypothetical protein
MTDDDLPRSCIGARAVSAVPFTRAALAIIGRRVGALGKLRLGHYGSRLLRGSRAREPLVQHIQRDLQLPVIGFAERLSPGPIQHPV